MAQRVAEEVGCILGEEVRFFALAFRSRNADPASAFQVGYSVRFEGLCTPDTKVLYLTDGMLFREILLDPLLSRCVSLRLSSSSPV